MVDVPVMVGVEVEVMVTAAVVEVWVGVTVKVDEGVIVEVKVTGNVGSMVAVRVGYGVPPHDANSWINPFPVSAT
jgi:hypothetical protein